MPTTIAQGPLGLEAKHTVNGFTMNDLAAVFPRVQLSRITGFYSLADGDDLRDKATARIGEVILPSMPRGKTLVYEGRIQAGTLAELRTTAAALRAAFANWTTEQVFTIAPHPDYGSISWFYRGRTLQVDMDDLPQRRLNILPKPYELPFTAGVRLSDPRFYTVQEVNAQAAGSVEVTNEGSAPVDPIITVNSPPGDFVLSRGALSLELDGVAGGGDVIFDFRNRRITQGSEDVTGALVAGNSDWWNFSEQGIPPGTHTITVSGGYVLEVQFNHASW